MRSVLLVATALLLCAPACHALLFDCPPLPPRAPANVVADLHPQDIRAVVALGDSITAGFSMKDVSWETAFYEYRGSVYSIGADAGEPTVYNWLKQIGANVSGGSVGTSGPLDAVLFGNFSLIPHNPPVDRLNGAQSNAVIMNVPEQIDYVANQLATVYKNVTVGEDWILWNVLIGANDLCRNCDQDMSTNVAEYTHFAQATLQKINQTFPRSFVNILPVFGFSRVYYFARTAPINWPAIAFQNIIEKCSCFLDSNTTRAYLDAEAAAYKQVWETVVAEYSGESQFAAVVQPFLFNLLDSTRGAFNASYVSPLDDFHPNAKADEIFAVGLWNNMLQPIGSKQNITSPANLQPLCPDSNTLIYS